jgi:hypothetical protein
VIYGMKGEEGNEEVWRSMWLEVGGILEVGGKQRCSTEMGKEKREERREEGRKQEAEEMRKENCELVSFLGMV